MAALQGAWRYSVSAWTGWHGDILWLGEIESLINNVSAWTGWHGDILWLGEIESLINNFFLTVAVYIHLSKQIRRWDILACCWDVRKPMHSNISCPGLLSAWLTMGCLSTWAILLATCASTYCCLALWNCWATFWPGCCWNDWAGNVPTSASCCWPAWPCYLPHWPCLWEEQVESYSQGARRTYRASPPPPTPRNVPL